MQDQERKLLIAEKMQSFNKKIEEMMTNPLAVTQENGLKLVAEVDEIIQEIHKLESIAGYEALAARMEFIKHRLLEALFTTERKEG
jgi:glutamate mutase epsilon subunit